MQGENSFTENWVDINEWPEFNCMYDEAVFVNEAEIAAGENQTRYRCTQKNSG